MISIAICGGQTINELRSQSLDLTQYLSRWITWGCPAAAWGVRRLTCLKLPRDLILESLSHLNLLGDPPVQGSQEVFTPQPAQEPNFLEADLPQPAQGFNLQEAVTPQSVWGSAP